MREMVEAFADRGEDDEGGDIRNEIARLEARLEALAEQLERCRKISLAAKLAVAVGALWLLLMLLGVLWLAPINIVGPIAALIGGTVLVGSNASTWKQTASAIAAAEARRAELIDAMHLHVVGDEVGRLLQ